MPSKAASILGIDSTADYVQRGALPLNTSHDEDDADEAEERNSAHATTTSATTGRSFCFSRKSHQQQLSASTIPASLGAERNMSEEVGAKRIGMGGRRWSESGNILVRNRKSDSRIERTESPFPLVVQHILPPPPLPPLPTSKKKSKSLAKLFFTPSKPSLDLLSPLSSISSSSSFRQLSSHPPPSPTSSLASSSWRAPDSWLITPDDVEVLKSHRGREGSCVRERSRSGSVRKREKRVLEREREEEVVRSLRPV